MNIIDDRGISEQVTDVMLERMGERRFKPGQKLNENGLDGIFVP